MKPYLQFIFKDRFTARWLFIAVAAIVLQLVVLKWLYPFASYFVDSYSYISAAADHASVSYRPIGYSRFLSFVHSISASEKLLVSVQWLLLELGVLHFFFSVLYFYRPGPRTRLLLFLVLFFNPLLLYLCNYVSSDAFFAGLSLFWFTGLLWIINRPRLYQLLLQVLWLYIIIQTRFVALYYPLVGIAALLLSTQKRVYKAAGVLLIGLVSFFCIERVQKATESATGTRIFSAFSGWQMANNSLHVYCYVEQDTSGIPSECRELAAFVRTYFDTVCPRLRGLPAAATTDYMLVESSPLMKYFYYKWRKDRLPGYFEAWNAVAPLYSDYGNWLMKKHPAAFARYYLWPSAKTYLAPPPEIMAQYNEGADTVGDAARNWFRYDNKQVSCVFKSLQGRVLAPFPVFFLLANLLLLLSMGWFLLVKGFREASDSMNRSLLLVAFFFIMNSCFSIFATPSSLRYEVFPLVIYACFSLLIVGWLWNNRLRRRFSGRS
ncbi:MAG TPA: hypothetical protein VGM41_14505 [Chitinophagaceae bacterium]